jgi:hypothetical protein
MRYFSGFCLCGEEKLFEDYLDCGEFCVAGFSRGAQKALDFVLNTKERIDKLQLFSPAFFDVKKIFVDKNLEEFRKNKENYAKKFLKKAGLDNFKFLCEKNCSESELEALFSYDWKKIEKANLKIEVFIGEKDLIVNPKKSYEFFKKYANVYMIKKANHFLRS